MIFGFSFFPILFTLMFVLVFGIILYSIIRSARQWNRNNHSPVLTVPAVIVTKRAHTTGHMNATNGVGSASTHYFVTFQVESGDRMELPVSALEYGMLAEGDSGKLTFQGTRFLRFDRE